MRAVTTRVTSASVTVDGEVVGRIDEPGLLVLVGVTHTDTADTARALAAKLHELRILRGDESCATTGAPLLVVSQFTLYASTDKGRRPSWNLAAPGDQAEPLVRELVAELRRRGRGGRDRRLRRHDAGHQRQRRAVHRHRRAVSRPSRMHAGRARSRRRPMHRMGGVTPRSLSHAVPMVGTPHVTAGAGLGTPIAPNQSASAHPSG